MTSEIDIPDEILDKLKNFHKSLKDVDEILQPLTEINVNSSDLQISPLDKARLNLACGYALNSLFWMYLNTLGINPKEHSIKTELERYKSFMLRVKKITDKEKAPVLNKGAAQRFVRNALWMPNENDESSESIDVNTPELQDVNTEEKRSHSFRGNDKRKKRRH